MKVEGAGNVFWDMSNTNFTVSVSGGAPNVTGVTSSTANGAYPAGTSIPIEIAFSNPVTVTGTPRLALGTTPTTRYADFSAGSGTSTLTFSYTVVAGDTSADLDYASGSALELNGGSIKDTATGTQDAILVLATPGTASLGAARPS